jgi:ELWxxDGT repeat protein
LLKDVDPYGNGNVNYLLRHGSRHLWFTATTTVHGSELHRTDGTASGTIRVGDINPGDNNSLPFWTTLAGGKIYFRANDGVRGNELYVVELPGATAMLIGTGCPDGAAPTITADDPELGGSITLQVAGAPATVAGMMFVTLPEQGIHLGFGCVLYVNPAAIAATIAFTTSGSGSYSTGAIPVPNTPALAGVVLNAQSGVTDLAVPPLGVALTNGLALTLGK